MFELVRSGVRYGEELMRQMVAYLGRHVWQALSVVGGGYCVWALHLHVGFPPTGNLTFTAVTYLALAVFFAIHPYARRLKVGKLIEYEAKVEQVQADLRVVRSETREMLNAVSILANAVSVGVNQQVVVSVPSLEAVRSAREELLPALAHSSEPASQEERILEYLGAGESNVHYALARLRMDLERELRRVLGKRLDVDDPSRTRRRFLSARSLFRQLEQLVPRYGIMRESFDYLLQVCNAAIHGQRIPEDVAHEAIDMGLRMLRELENEREVGALAAPNQVPR